MPGRVALWLPIEPLLPFFDDESELGVEARRRMRDRNVNVTRIRHDGFVSVMVADSAACALGFHPFQLWPEWFDLPITQTQKRHWAAAHPLPQPEPEPEREEVAA